MSRTSPKVVPVSQLRRLIDSGTSVTAFARERHMSFKRLKEQIEAAGLRVPSAGVRAGTTQYPQLTKQFLTREYVKLGRSAVDIAAQVGCSERTVRTALDACGIATRGHGSRRAPAALTEQNLRRWYVDDEDSVRAIARRAGSTVETVSAYLERYGIPIRPRGKDVDEKMLKKLFDGDASYRKMADALGVSVGKVHKVIGDLGWTR